MQEADRPEFERMLRELFGALDKPLTEHQRNAFWRGLSRMSLLEFERCRDRILRDLEDGEPPRRFGVDSIWAAKTRLRASGAPAKPASDNWHGDDWDHRASLRLLSHVLRAAVARRSFDSQQVAVLVAAKNRWAALMRDAQADGSAVLIEDQDATWKATIQQAQGELAGSFELEGGRAA